jgi:hypothetical protein
MVTEPQQDGCEDFRQRLVNCVGLVHEFEILAETGDQLGASVRRPQDQRIREVDVTPLSVFHEGLVEDTEENLEHVGMGFLDFVRGKGGATLCWRPLTKQRNSFAENALRPAPKNLQPAPRRSA